MPRLFKSYPRGYSYNQIRLLPDEPSSFMHRDEADTSQVAFGVKFDIPLIASPMPDVCNGRMICDMLRFEDRLKTSGIIHRFQSIENQLNEFHTAVVGWNLGIPEVRNKVPCAIGITGDYIERAIGLFHAGCRVFCMDTSNGFSIRETNAIKEFWKRFDPNEVYLIAGNVADGVGYKYLANNDFHLSAIRVGVAGGSACNTRQEAGVYYPMASAIADCYNEKCKLEFDNERAPLIIADGGVSTPGDFSVAIALGADFVLAGGIFAGTKESPATLIKNEATGELSKIYRGAASYGVQHDFNGVEPEYNEGAERLIKYTGSVEKVIKRFRNGLRSGMSYMNSRTLEEFRQNANFVIID